MMGAVRIWGKAKRKPLRNTRGYCTIANRDPGVDHHVSTFP